MRTSYNILDGLSRAQAERLAYIDFRLYFLGELSRAALTERFGMASAGATRDIALYREIAPANICFDGSAKVYRPSMDFQPIFDHPLERALTALSQGFGEGVAHEQRPLVRCEFPVALNLPKLQILAPLTRAIHLRLPARIRYCSNTSGYSDRVIVPFALVDSGLRWHTRAFDRKSESFRDFVLTRIASIEVLHSDNVASAEQPECDAQWFRMIDLELVPHPAHERPEAVKMDYGIESDVLRVPTRAATAGYMLRRWSVDCSPDHRLSGPEYALWLRDPLVLYGAETAVLAPGYQHPRNITTGVSK
ncbi:MAG: WYL domain-containing protein [Betaproteobacteria bacterium]|nr:WYL domain-containing protein [Betaproteobacteria bacterium]